MLTYYNKKIPTNHIPSKNTSLSTGLQHQNQVVKLNQHSVKEFNYTLVSYDIKSRYKLINFFCM